MGDVLMTVDRLEAVIRRPLPEGFTLRRYRPGDRETWTRIHVETGFYDPLPPGLHEREFGADDEALRARQLFVSDVYGVDVATATAWFNDPAQGVPGGRIHWVAVVPAVQGRGIASALVGILCDRFAELGEETAYLTTDGHNTRAIALYKTLGFRPVA